MILPNSQIIVQCHYYHASLKSLKDLLQYLIDVCTVLNITKFLMTSMVFVPSIQPWPYSYMAIAKLPMSLKKKWNNNWNILRFIESFRSIDLIESFQSIDHKILLHKLEHYGFRGIVYAFNNYCTSNPKSIICGVPQGSILGSILFILYVNDIPYTSNILDFILFADDTTIFVLT